MAKCDFDIAFSGSADNLVKTATEAIGGAGGIFKGDITSGEFELSTPVGGIKGTYSLQEGSIHISIHSKPLLLSCSRIEEELRNYLAK